MNVDGHSGLTWDRLDGGGAGGMVLRARRCSSAGRPLVVGYPCVPYRYRGERVVEVGRCGYGGFQRCSKHGVVMHAAEAVRGVQSAQENV